MSILVAMTGVSSVAAQEIILEPVVLSGDPAPGTLNLFEDLGFAAIDADGNIFFVGWTDAWTMGLTVDNTGIWNFDRDSGILSPVVIQGDTSLALLVGGFPIAFSDFQMPNVRPDGTVVYSAGIEDSLGNFLGGSLWSLSPAGINVLLAFDGSSVIGSADPTVFFDVFTPVVNANGDVVAGAIELTLGGLTERALLAGSTTTVLTTFADGIELAGFALDPHDTLHVLNNAGQLSAVEQLDGAAVEVDTRLLFWEAGAGAPTVVVTEGWDTGIIPPTKTESYILREISTPTFGPNGELIFVASLKLPSDGFFDRDPSLWRYHNGVLTPLIIGDRLIVTTSEGDTIFRDFSSPVYAPDGSILFIASVALEPGNPVTQGVWRMSAGGAITLLYSDQEVAPGSASTFNLFSDIVMAPDGSFAFHGRLADGNTGLWAVAVDGTTQAIAIRGQQIEVAPGEFRTVQGVILAGSGLYDGQLSGLTSDGIFAVHIDFVDGSEGILSVLVAGSIIDPVGFQWSGPNRTAANCSTVNWHTDCGAITNWNDDVGDPRSGLPGADDDVSIDNADVVIDQAAVSVKSLTATGSLTVREDLTLQDPSSIESLSLNAVLTNSGGLTLTGTSSWNSGTFAGPGTVTVDNTSTLVTPLADAVLEGILDIEGRLIHTAGTALTVNLLDGISILTTGQLEVESGSIVGTNAASIVNAGQIFKTGGGTFTFDIPFVMDGGIVNAQAGDLIFGNTIVLAGPDPSIFDVSAGATMEIAGGLGGAQSVTFTGDGTTRTTGVPLVFPDMGLDASVTFNMTGGGAFVVDGSGIDSLGLMRNTGNLSWVNGKIEVTHALQSSGLINEGELRIEPAAPASLVLRTGVQNTGTVLHEGGATLLMGDNIQLRTSGAGSYTLNSGNILPETVGAFDTALFLLDGGTLTVNSSDPSEIRVPFQNVGGTLQVNSNFFELSGPTAILDNAFVRLSGNANVVITADTTVIGTVPVSGRGRIVFAGPLDLQPSAELVFVQGAGPATALLTDTATMHAGSFLEVQSFMEVDGGSIIGAGDDPTQATITVPMGGQIFAARANLENLSIFSLGRTGFGDASTLNDVQLNVGAGGRVTFGFGSISWQSSEPGASLLHMTEASLSVSNTEELDLPDSTFIGSNIVIDSSVVRIETAEFMPGGAASSNDVQLVSTSITGILAITTGGTWGITGPFNLSGDGFFNIQDTATLTLRDGQIDFNLGGIGTLLDLDSAIDIRSGANLMLLPGNKFILDGGEILLVDGGSFTNEGSFEWRAGDLTSSGPDFLNTGEFTVTPDGDRTFEGPLVNENLMIVNGSFTGSGDDTTLLNNEDGRIEITSSGGPVIIAMSADSEDAFENLGTVELMAGSTATIQSAKALRQNTTNVNDALLNGGTWTVHDGATLTLENVFLGRPVTGDIEAIFGDAILNLHGSGTLNNLPLQSPVDNFLPFEIFGHLNLLDGASWTTGPLHLFNPLGPVTTDRPRLNIDASSSVVFSYPPAGGAVGVPGVMIDSRAALSVDGLLSVSSLLNHGGTPEIRNQGLLTGFGTIVARRILNSGTINGMLEISGTISPGASPGILTIDADYTQTSDGILEIEIGGTTPGTEYDQLIVLGTATLEAGAQINVTFIDLGGGGNIFEPSSGDTFGFLATNALILAPELELADYINFTNAPDRLRWNLTPGTLDGLTLWQLSLILGADFLNNYPGLMGNAFSVGAALDGATTSSGSAALTDFALAIEDLGDASMVQTRLSQAGFSFASGLYDLTQRAASGNEGRVTDRLDSIIWSAIRAGNATAATANPVQVAANTFETGPVNVMNDGTKLAILALASSRRSGSVTYGDRRGLRSFASVAYESGDFSGNVNRVGLNYDGFSTTVGFEYQGDEGWVVGLAGGFADLKGDTSDDHGELQTEVFSLNAYGAVSISDWLAIDGSVGTFWADLATERVLDVPGEGFTAVGDTKGHGIRSRLRLTAPFGDASLSYGPFVELSFVSTSIDGFSESGGGDASLTLTDGKAEEFVGRLGLAFGGNISVGEEGTLSPRLELAWENLLHQDRPMVVANFRGGPDHPFDLMMDPNSKNAFTLRGALTGNLAAGWSLSAGYDGRFSSEGTAHSLWLQGAVNL